MAKRIPSASGQKNPIELGTLLMSIGGGGGGKLWVLTPSVRILQPGFSGRLPPKNWLSSGCGALPCNISQDPFTAGFTGPANKGFHSDDDDDDGVPFSVSTRTSVVILPVSSGWDRLSRKFLDKTDPIDFLEDRRFLACVHWHSRPCLNYFISGAPRRTRKYRHRPGSINMD